MITVEELGQMADELRALRAPVEARVSPRGMDWLRRAFPAPSEPLGVTSLTGIRLIVDDEIGEWLEFRDADGEVIERVAVPE